MATNSKHTKWEDQKKKDINRLTSEEKKIYNAVLRHFPATSHDSAMDAALQGGIKWNFICK